ncbi:MAG: aminotransferase class IV, partial [Halanaerobium sp.]|nr:aminotransferase class IV [Halanaerobium sp.]
MTDIVYFNGEFLPYSEAHISIEDRGYQFADGVYEVVAVYNGVPFMLEEHFARLKRSAEALEIEVPDYQDLLSASKELLKKVEPADVKIYIQVTRGTTIRSHAYPDDLTPNVVMTIRPMGRHPEEYFSRGVKVITLPDDRWS